MPGPIKPEEIAKLKTKIIPEPVFEAFNEMIVQEWNAHLANFSLTEVANLALKKLKASSTEYKNLTCQAMYDKGWMDVEDSYREAGWDVEFDKPGYNETYEANFTFKK